MDTIEQPSIVGASSPEQIEVYDAKEQPSISPMRAAVRRFLRDRRAVVCLGIILFLVIFSFLFPLLYVHMGPKVLDGISGKLIPPELYHQFSYSNLAASDKPGTLFPLGPNSLTYPLGGDPIGRDMLARLMAGINVSIEVALFVEVFDIGLGVLFGTLAGWYGGWLGTVLDRFTDIVFAFPGLLLIILMGAALGPIFDNIFKSINPILGRIVMLTLAIGLLAWPLMMRFVRGQTLNLKEQQFVEASRVSGTPDGKAITQHIIPNLLNIVVVASTLSILGSIVGEAALSVLGVGIRPPGSSLGLMISDSLESIYGQWTELFWPAFVLVVLIVCFSFVGDGVRDAFDPRTKD
ncbi:MAG: oligopeptide ABC transporter, permease protein OppC [Ktedonobacterales bacterium]|jgi:ABC-type dipeptide/oligopeptide/nickel transport system permease subunit|nr:MAG: oligopeptide ABC transporter, permease protein OppC [Ktedonobacterales bacterium]